MISINNRKLCENCFAKTDREPCPYCGFNRASYVNDPATLAVGSILERRYVIGKMLGKGGFGITYLAYDMKLERKVAIKEYYPYGLAVRNIGSTFVSVSNAESAATFQSGADKFFNEARLVAKFIGNPNIVSIYDFFYENNTVYFTMEFLKGKTLKEYIKEHGILSSGQAVCIANDISSALTAAHNMKVLHRDISPDNIMICDDGSNKLLDFGAARQVLTEGSQSLSVILKQGFAPLEQYQKKGKQGPWTDIYALGATIYYALTMEFLDDPMSRLENDGEYSSNKHGIAPELWAMIQKATMLKVSDRYQNIHELKDDLGRLSIKPEPIVLAGASADSVSSSMEDSMEESMEYSMKRVSSTSKEHQETAASIGVTMPLPMQIGASQSQMPLSAQGAASQRTMALSMPGGSSQSGGNTPQKEQSSTGLKNRIKKQWVFIIAASAIALLAIIVVCVKLFRSGDSDSTQESIQSQQEAIQSQQEAEPTESFDSPEDSANQAETGYVNYINETVCFSVEYPEGYMVTETYANGVQITNGDVWVAVEYAFQTVDGSVIYSAEDFALQVRADVNVLTDWLGGEDIQLMNASARTVVGRSCYEYDFELQRRDHPYSGKLFIFDSDGDFGCYSYFQLYNKDAENAALYQEQLEAMLNSFRVTGSYQEEGYTLYTYDEYALQFVVRDEAMAETQVSSGTVFIYPAEHVFTEASITMRPTAYTVEDGDEMDDVLSVSAEYYFDYYDQTRYDSQKTTLRLGRYSYTGFDVEYYNRNKKFYGTLFVLEHDGVYWKIELESTDEYYDTAINAFGDVLTSLRFMDDTASELSSRPVEDVLESKMP